MALDGRIPVLLLKTKSTPHDGYEEYFCTPDHCAYIPQFVPVLEHRFREEALQEIESLIEQRQLFSGDSSVQRCKYGGIIFTSQRAVEAFSKVVEDVRKSSGMEDVGLTADLPLYVVGPATARGLGALNLPCPIVGEETGNGEALAAFMLDHYNEWMSERRVAADEKPPLLFLVGEQRRDIIPKTLEAELLGPERRIRVNELVVYETAEMKSFASQFSRQYEQNITDGANVQWIVVFSPTGCKAMLESLHLLDQATGHVDEAAVRDKHMLIATIGPTTRDYLKREFDFEPEVCAPKPSPEGVGTAIKMFMDHIVRKTS